MTPQTHRRQVIGLWVLQYWTVKYDETTTTLHMSGDSPKNTKSLLSMEESILFKCSQDPRTKSAEAFTSFAAIVLNKVDVCLGYSSNKRLNTAMGLWWFPFKCIGSVMPVQICDKKKGWGEGSICEWIIIETIFWKIVTVSLCPVIFILKKCILIKRYLIDFTYI